ncbi:MAG: FHA domain-containing protein [Gammaproteobacteria bacterium]|nr:FHA domain-containing protein [Gammaproteobacteria bacterium]
MMAAVGLEIVDAALVAVRAGARVAASPGVAIVAPADLKVGEAAAAQQRLQPVLAADRFWSDLATDSFAGAAGQAVSHADLAHAHLASVWRAVATPGDEAVLALPGSMRLHQAGLLLGIARHVGMPVAGVVDAAVAATAGLAARTEVLHLDVQLHQAVLTVLDGETVLRRRRVEIAPRAGLKVMFGAWAQLVSEAMVRRTRFDPLHQASTEQQLYDRLPGWLATLAGRESLDVAVESGGSSFVATVRREQFTLAAEAWYAQLAELVRTGLRGGGPATLALSARAALLPALAERLGALPGLEVTVLAETAAAEAAAARAAEIGPAEPPTLVTALARVHAAAPAMRRAVGTPATHVVVGGRAHAIDERPLVIGFGEGAGRRIALGGAAEGISRSHCTLLRDRGRTLVRDHSRFGTFLNGGRVAGEAEVGAGDRLRVGSPGVVFELVAAD